MNEKAIFEDDSEKAIFEDSAIKAIFEDDSENAVFDITLPENNAFPYTFPYTLS